MTKYYCTHCGWEGEDVIEWEEHPRDEFWYKCPKCHHTDMDIMRFDGEVWVPAVIFKEPSPEEIEHSKRAYDKLNSLLAVNNVYREAIYRTLKDEVKE